MACSGTFDDVPNWDTLNRGGYVPSWVPDWNTVYRSTLLPWAATDSFAASNGMPLALHAPEAKSTTHILALDGIEVGTICYVHSADWRLKEFLPKALATPFFQSKEGLQILACTLVAHRDENGFLNIDDDQIAADFAASMLSEQYDKGFDENLRGLLAPLVINGDAARHKIAQQSVCQRRSLFFTTNGFLGIGPNCVQEGDVIYVLSGAQTPFVLRRITGPENEEAGMHAKSSAQRLQQSEVQDLRYVVVGECYMHGIMDGEVVAASDQGISLKGPVPINFIRQMTVDRLVNIRDWEDWLPRYTGSDPEDPASVAAQRQKNLEFAEWTARVTYQCFEAVAVTDPRRRRIEIW